MKMDTKKLILALLVAAAAMSATTASADELYLEMHGSSVATADTQRVLAASPTVGGPGIYVGVEPDAFAGGRLMLGYDGDGLYDTRHFAGDLESTWVRTRVMAKADWGYDLVGDWLRPLVRTGVGYSYQRLMLTADNTTYRGTDHGISAMVAGGLESRFIFGGNEDADGRFSLGANLLVGYSWNSRADFDGMETTEELDDDDPWQRGTYDAGSMQLSGITYSVGVTAGYRFGQ